MTTAISTSDPSTERAGDWGGWVTESSLLRSTSLRANFQSRLAWRPRGHGRCDAHLFRPLLVVPCRWSDLASKDAVADHSVEQHQREDEQALAPEHEGETGMRCGGFLDRDRERDHVGPERDCESAEGESEN